MKEMIKPLFKELDDKVAELYNYRKIDENLISLRNQILDKVRCELYSIRDLEIKRFEKLEKGL